NVSKEECMKQQIRRLCLLPRVFLCGSLLGAPRPATQPPHTKRAPESVTRVTENEPPAPAALPSTKVVAYGDKDVIPVRTKLRFTTMIILPKEEQILDFTCGDKEFWVVNGEQNFAHVKPAKLGAQTNLNLVTASGNIYSFILSEVSEIPKAEPDLKVFVELKDDGMVTA